MTGVPLHRAEVVVEGTDVTVVAYGPMVATALDAARIGDEEGTSIEVIDLRSLSPLDFETVEASVRKTGRLVVAHEAPVFCGLGAEIAARVSERCFYHLESPVRRVGGFATPYPPSRLEAPLPARRRPDPRRGRPVPPGVTAVRHFVLPDLGEGLTEAEVVAWHVAVGDEVALNQVLVEVETEKAVVELPSPYAGTVVELLAEAGETVAVGAPIIAIEHRRTEHGDAGRAGGEGADAGRLRPVGRRRPAGAGGYGAPHGGATGHAASRPPGVRWPRRRCASWPGSTGSTWPTVAGHGPGGVVTREDLAAHLAGADRRAPAADRRETRTPVRGVQKHMAEAMVRSVATAPQACVFLTVDVTPTVQLVGRLRENRHFEGLRVTPLAVVARAVVARPARPPRAQLVLGRRRRPRS